MYRIIGRRLISIVPILVIASFGVFILGSLVPGDPAVTLAGGTNATYARVAEIRSSLHLDDPLVVQYWHWLTHAVRLDFGESLYTHSAVMSTIGSRLGVTLGLVLAAVILAIFIGLPLGIFSAMLPGRAPDHAARLFSTAGVAIPNFCVGIALVIVFAVKLTVLPPSGYVPFSASPGHWMRYMAMPALALAIGLAAVLVRQLRASMLDVLDSNFVRAAWAKGGTRRAVILRHCLKNASMPPLTVLGVQIGHLIGGTVIIEQIFSVPGLGNQMLRAITEGDLPMLEGITVIFVLFQVAISLAVDLAYAVLNPKIRVA